MVEEAIDEGSRGSFGETALLSKCERDLGIEREREGLAFSERTEKQSFNDAYESECRRNVSNLCTKFSCQ